MRIIPVFVMLLFALLGQSAAATVRATLLLNDDTSPPTLRGAGFEPREHVRVVLVAGSTRAVKKVVATPRGRFTVRVTVGANACAGLSATAVGNEGTRASFKRAPGQCPAP